MPRRPVIAGNWKMHGTAAETSELVASLRARLGDGVLAGDVVIAPPFTSLGAAAPALRGSSIELAAQNVHWEAKGAFTGEVSASMLLEAGCRWVIVGHSERRQHFGETDEQVNARTRAALDAGMRVIVCIGETLGEREAGHAFEVLGRQLRAALKDVGAAAIGAVCVAYEPVWAIGTGRTATPDQAEEAHREIRGTIEQSAGHEAARDVRILYGGSVKPDNIDALMAQANIDGALVGGASLEAESFARIVQYRR